MVKVKRFHANWCQPCKTLAPTIERVRGQFPQVSFVDIDVDTNPEEARVNHVRNIPLVLIEKNGQVIDRISGVNAESLYTQKIRQAI